MNLNWIFLLAPYLLPEKKMCNNIDKYLLERCFPNNIDECLNVFRRDISEIGLAYLGKQNPAEETPITICVFQPPQRHLSQFL